LFDLVKEYIPEERARLLKMVPADAAKEFIKAFSKRYFPLRQSDRQDQYYYHANLNHMTLHIPLDWHGMKEWDYEPIRGISHAQLLAESICVCPFEGQRNDRIAVLTQFTKVMGEEAAEPLIKLLPSRGCPIEDVEQALKDSPYPGLLPWCQWVFARTGNRWLDTSHGGVEWSRETVDQLTQQWPRYLEMDRKMKDFDKWLNVNLPWRSAEVITYVANKVKHNHDSLLINVLAGGTNDAQND
jgi:hypothetical protein